MKPTLHQLPVLFIALALLGCNRAKPQATAQAIAGNVLNYQLQQHMRLFDVPGLAVLVQQNGTTVHEAYLGMANRQQGTAMAANTVVPLASITKLYAAALIMKLQALGKLNINHPVTRYVPDAPWADTITVRHLLSHTSQGPAPGTEFLYSYRYGWLTGVVAAATGMPFEAALQQYLLTPLGLTNTYLMTDSATVAAAGGPLASPYQYNGQSAPGQIEYGTSAAAGLMATASDVAAFSQALDQNQLLTASAWQQMQQPAAPGLPYGLGLFTQQAFGRQLVWAYGQYDCYGTLLLKVPAANITCVLLANNNLPSDPARLIYGDVTYSLFALSLLQYLNALAPTQRGATGNGQQPSFEAQQMLAQALAYSFLARWQTERFDQSLNLLASTYNQYPQLRARPSLTQLHCLSYLQSVANHKGLSWQGSGLNLERELLATAHNLLQQTPNNPYVHYYLASHYMATGQPQQARPHWQHIVHAPNHSPFWYTAEAQQALSALDADN